MPAAARRLPILATALLALTVWAGSAGCHQGPAPPRPSLLLVTVDTLRADFLGAYGSTETSTPHVDRLAAAGTRFDNATASMPVTRPSLFTILTARYPRDHGVTDNHLALPASEVTVAEALREAGYRTAAFTGVAFLDRASGAAQGFDTFEAPTAEQSQVRADQVVRKAADWLRAGGSDRPFFLWIHVYDPHMPYEPPATFLPPGPGRKRIDWSTLRHWADLGGGDIGQTQYRRGVDLYAGEVEAVDAAFGLLELELRERGVAEETVTVFTADHGECFENGFYFRHADCLYDGAIRVPLIVRYPGRVPAGEVVAEPVEHLDLAPTLLAFAGLEPAAPFGGHALYGAEGEPATLPAGRHALFQHPLSSTGGTKFRRQLWAEIARVLGEPVPPFRNAAETVGLRSARWKYVAGRKPEGGADEQLYHLAEDPGETRNVAEERRDVAERLRAELRRLLAEHPLNVLDEGELDPALRRQLEALGYL